MEHVAVTTDLDAALRAGDDLVLHGLRHRAATAGDAVFLISEESDLTYTYAEFDGLVRRVANGFLRLGLGKGDPVCVLTRNPVTATVTMFALWRAGLLYSPVNFNLTGETLAYQLADTRPLALVCEDALTDALSEVHAAIDATCTVILEHRGQAPSANGLRRLCGGGRHVLGWTDLIAQDDEPNVERRPSDAANIIYTSGTTGHPKGVVQPYRWMNQYTFAVRQMLTPEDVVYNDLPLYHIGGAMWMVARAAWAGASVGVWEKFSVSEFWNRVGRIGATTANLLDVMIPWLTNAEPTSMDHANTLNKVHLQPLPLYHHELAARFGIEWVSVGFGQTETGDVSFAVIDETADNPGTPAHLRRGLSHDEMVQRCVSLGLAIVPGDTSLAKGFAGRPLPYMDVAVVDEADEVLPAGTSGELVVRPRLPHLLLQGYFNRPDATVAANRNYWFHTGDVAYRDEAGYLYWVDRAGDRIRTRGENVSSAQVEDLLNRMPDVTMSAVFAIPSSEGLEHDIVAFVVPGEGRHLIESHLRSWMIENIPRFMQPRHLRIVDELPRTPTNKVQKFKLREAILAELNGENVPN